MRSAAPGKRNDLRWRVPVPVRRLSRCRILDEGEAEVAPRWTLSVARPFLLAGMAVWVVGTVIPVPGDILSISVKNSATNIIRFDISRVELIELAFLQ